MNKTIKCPECNKNIELGGYGEPTATYSKHSLRYKDDLRYKDCYLETELDAELEAKIRK